MPVVAVAGGGPAGLIAAETIATAGVRVVVFEHMASVGRKFLLAGRGGLNLTHCEDLDTFLTRYRSPAACLVDAIRGFGPHDLRAWADGLGEETFVGSSGRVFPKSFRAAPLLRAWLRRLAALDVEVRVRHEWRDWPLVVADRDGVETDFAADAVVLALGGASWPRTGSDGRWSTRLPVTALHASNVGFRVTWSEEFRTRFAGTPLKDVVLRVGAEYSRGDAMVTGSGVEGGAVYAVSSPLRADIERVGSAELRVDLRPDQTAETVAERLSRRRPKESTASWLRGAGFAPIAVSLLREATTNKIPVDARACAALIKAVPVAVVGVQGIERAISTAGGVPFDAVDERFMLRTRPGVFVAGEMLDWDAPTGGYLLQACFSTGVAAGRGALAWLADGNTLQRGSHSDGGVPAP
ncbi:MAG: hypothetical protein QOK28_1516 [Actinomycetota bacterium]|jgi:uncharacterized flavoprotein (TIGR03862 family)